jgi:hypothetical protein
MIIPGREVLVKRLPQSVRNVDGVQSADTDNLYYQRALETMYRSYTLSGIIPKKAGFLNGEGFEQPETNDIVVHGEGLDAITMRELLDHSGYSKSWSRGLAWHINFNLNYTMASVKPIPFEYCRLGIPDDEGCVDKIAYSTNWERDYSKEQKNREIIFYDKFNPDPEYLAEQFEKYGVDGYEGQIMYWTPEKNKYPLCSFDSVFEQAQTQAEIALYSLNQTVNGFTAGHIFIYPGTFQNDTERSDYKKRLSANRGGKGGGSIMVIEAGTKDIKVSDLLAKTDLQNNDRMFEFTLNWIEKSILQNYGMPYEILGRQSEGAMFSRQQIEDAYTYYNAVTRDERVELSRIFKKVFQFWNKPINSDFTIKPQVYEVESNTLAPSPETLKAQAALKGSVGGVQGILSIQESVSNGKTSYESGVAILIEIFGFTQDVARSVLGTPKLDPTTVNLPAAGQPTQMVTQAAAVDPVQEKIDSIIRGLSRRDASKVFAYVNDFKKGRMNLEQAKTFLIPFLQTEENVMKFLQDPEGDGADA